MASNRRIRFLPNWRMLGSACLFLVIPLVFTVAVVPLNKVKGPQWLMYNFENPYNYLCNSLLLLKGQAPHCINHPGTATQIFGAAILRFSSLKSNDDLIFKAIHRPEREIRKLYFALLLVTVLVLWIAPWMTALAIRSYIIGLLIQIPSLFYGNLLWYAALFGPDLMLVPTSIAAVCCCVILVVPSDFRERLSLLIGIADNATGPGTTKLISAPLLAAITGLVCALGIATKLTFFPLVLIALLCCRNKLNVITYAVAFLFGLAVALLPIYSQISRLATWTVNLGIHSGRYDTGPVGLPPVDSYLASLSESIKAYPMLPIIACATVLLIILFPPLPKKQTPTNPAVLWRTALVLFLIQLISFFAIAKESGVHYLIPLALTTGLNLVLFFCTFQRVTNSPIYKVAGWIVLAGLVLIGLKGSTEWLAQTYASVHTQKARLLQLYRHAKEIAPYDVRADYFFSNSPEFALCYGNDWADGAFSPLLQRIYPNALFFNVFIRKFQTFTEFIAPEVIRQEYDHLYFFGTPHSFPNVEGFDPATFETIDEVGGCCLQKWTRK
jgi:hypothetical protein